LKYNKKGAEISIIFFWCGVATGVFSRNRFHKIHAPKARIPKTTLEIGEPNFPWR
jgi:hypothetical protein